MRGSFPDPHGDPMSKKQFCALFAGLILLLIGAISERWSEPYLCRCDKLGPRDATSGIASSICARSRGGADHHQHRRCAVSHNHGVSGEPGRSPLQSQSAQQVFAPPLAVGLRRYGVAGTPHFRRGSAAASGSLIEGRRSGWNRAFRPDQLGESRRGTDCSGEIAPDGGRTGSGGRRGSGYDRDSGVHHPDRL